MEKKKWGDYEILGTLGKGAQGIVYKARQDFLDRLVAIKVLPTTFAQDESFIARFTREAQNIARLSHPNIVHVYDMNIHEGNYYYVMEYVEGDDLGKMLKRGLQLSWEQIVDIVVQVASALDAAGEHEMVHRDIKPENILITAKGQVKVADFGLAKIKGASANVTREGMILGTVNYMAPEQAKGQECDIRSDLYSLGVVLFRLLTGEVPFTGENLHSIIYKHINEPPPHPRDLNPKIPSSLSKICHKLLEKKPERRYQTPKELIRALNSIQAPSVRTALMEKTSLQDFMPANDTSTNIGASSPTAALTMTTSRRKVMRGVNPIIGISFVLFAVIFAGYLFDRFQYDGKYFSITLGLLGITEVQDQPDVNPTPKPSPVVGQTTPPPELKTPIQMVAEASVTITVEPGDAVVSMIANEENVPVPPAENGVVALKLKPGAYHVIITCQDCKPKEFDLTVDENGKVEPKDTFAIVLSLTDEKAAEIEIAAQYRELKYPQDYRKFLQDAKALSIAFPENAVIQGFVINAHEELRKFSLECVNKAKAEFELLVALISNREKNVDLEKIDFSATEEQLKKSAELQDVPEAKELETSIQRLKQAIADFRKAEIAHNEAINNKSGADKLKYREAMTLYRKFLTTYEGFAPSEGLAKRAQARVQNIEKKLSDRDIYASWLDELEGYLRDIQNMITSSDFELAQKALKSAQGAYEGNKPRVAVGDEFKTRVSFIENQLYKVLPDKITKGLRNKVEVVDQTIKAFSEALINRDIEAFKTLLAQTAEKEKMIAELGKFFNAEDVTTVSIEKDKEKQSSVEDDGATFFLVWNLKVKVEAPDGKTNFLEERVPLEVKLVYVKKKWLITSITVK